MEVKEKISKSTIQEDQNFIEKEEFESDKKSNVTFVHVFESEVLEHPTTISDKKRVDGEKVKTGFFQKIRNYFQKKRVEEVKKIKLQMDAEKSLPKCYRSGECKKSIVRNLPQDYSFRFNRF